MNTAVIESIANNTLIDQPELIAERVTFRNTLNQLIEGKSEVLSQLQ